MLLETVALNSQKHDCIGTLIPLKMYMIYSSITIATIFMGVIIQHFIFYVLYFILYNIVLQIDCFIDVVSSAVVVWRFSCCHGSLTENESEKM